MIEPILVSYLGYTVGQYFLGIEVIRARTGSKCPLLVSFVRSCAKYILGTISLFYMLFSNKHQAIHDHLAKTYVILLRKKLERDPKFQSFGVTEKIPEATFTYPSALRRFGIFFVWYVPISVLAGFLIEIICLLALPGYTENERFQEPVEIFTDILFSIFFLIVALLAAKGYLPGRVHHTM